MSDLLQHQNFYLMGIKGVAMTSLAQILIDADKAVAGCDVRQEFVTQKILDDLEIKIDYGFVHELPEEADIIVYTSAHGGPNNPIVLQAMEQNIPAVSQAEALAYFFNQKKGIAVSGVGGKSTVSAMITWILNQNSFDFSFSVGVGKIAGLDRTGQWKPEADYFVAEADEYVIDPAVEIHQEIVPRFSFLKPYINVCTNLEYDHPDVYLDIHHSKRVFADFLLSANDQGYLVFNQDSQHLLELIDEKREQFKNKQIQLLSFGTNSGTDVRLINNRIENQTNLGKIQAFGSTYQLELPIPGEFNLMNALAALTAAKVIGIEVEQSLAALKTFRGTKRRFELKGIKNGIVYYDDYAHHPHEIVQTITALQNWHPNKRRVIAFQPHTFSRTKELLNQFAAALGIAEELVLLDIFPSARERFDPEISSDILLEEVRQNHPNTQIANLKTIESLADYCQHQLHEGDVLLTMGAGDIYLLYEKLELD